MESNSDPNTFSNYKDIKLNHLHIEWLINLDDKNFKAITEYQFTVITTGLSKIDLDIYQLEIQSVQLTENGLSLDHKIQVIDNQSLIQGDILSINLSRAYESGEKIQIRIKYTVDEKAKALSFMTKESTGGQKQPYMYSQCEMINCRSIIPLQDTPAVKHTFSATIISRPEINVFMSGNQTKPDNVKLIGTYDDIDSFKITTFETVIPFQSYLIAIIAGDVTQVQLGKRTYLITEPKYVEQYAEELSNVEDLLITLEEYIGPYLWGDFKIVVQPPSFPMGGMENPLLTFVSPSIITGDKSGVSVVVHEMAHSWTGNTVTCVNWSNFWLNEGMTVFLERKALRNSKYYGREYELIDSYTGNSSLNEAIDQLEDTPSYTSLYPITEGVDPDDSFSTVPYEKGFQLLTYLESFIGEQEFQQIFREFITKFQYQSIDHIQTRDFFVQSVRKNGKKGDIEGIATKIMNEWDLLIKGTGYPIQKQDFSTERILLAEQLAQSYLDLNGQQPPSYQDFQGYLTNQKYIFLQYLSKNQDSMNIAIITRIEADQNLSQNKNKEILWRWFRTTLQAKYFVNIEAIHVFLGEIGRQKMILPVYRELVKVDHDKAVSYFQEYSKFYHPQAKANILKIINSKKSQ